MKKNIPLLIFGALCVVFAILSVIQRFKLNEIARKPSSWKTDQIYVNNAVTIWAGKTNASRDVVMNNRYPVTLHFQNEVCVELRLELGSAGGSPVYCFDRQSHKVMYTFDTVE